MAASQVLIACGDPETRRSLVDIFTQSELEPVLACTVCEAHASLALQPISLTFCEDRLPGGGYGELLRKTQLSGSHIPLVVVSALGDAEQYLRAMEQGALDYITPPYRRADIESIVSRRREKRLEMKLPVQVYGTSANGLPFLQFARTRNISNQGALLEGIASELRPGAVIGVRCCDKDANFQVVWVRSADGSPKTQEVGIQSLTPANCIWTLSPVADEWARLVDPHARYGTST